MASTYSKLVPRFALVGALFCVVTAGFSAPAERIRGPVEGVGSVPLKGNISRRAQAATDLGALDLSVRITGMKLVLGQTPEQAAALEQLLEDQRNPSSPDFERWLTPEEYGASFGVSENDIGKLTSWLQSRGFAIEQVARARNWITFSGTAAEVARAFRTELHRYDAAGENHFANASEPWIPASLAGVVTGIRGLDDFRPRPLRPAVKINPDFNATNGFHYLGPGDLAAIYDIQALYKAGFDGTGQKLVIAGQTDISLADIRSFRSQFGLPAKDPQLVLVGADPGTNPSDRIEADLDIEWSGAVARNATVIYVYSQNVFESLQYAIDQDLAPVASVSYGGCEAGGSLSYRTLAQQANAEGITWMNSSGDSGAAGCDYGGEAAAQGPAVTFPADIPEVTAVGGTEFNEGSGSYWSSSQNAAGLESALSYIPETAWNDTSLGYGLASGGGGASAVYAKPWWQTGPGVPNDQARDTPDVSLSASGDHDAYVIYTGGGLMAVGGTSASSPSFAGVVSILNQYLITAGTLAKPGLGNINPSLYSLAANTSGLFHDVTAGNNIVPCAAGSTGCASGSFGYTAGPGYDLATGLGSVDAYNLVTRWNSLPPGVGTKAALVASPAGIAAAATTQLTATVTAVTGSNPPTGSVAFLSGTTVLGTTSLGTTSLAGTSGAGATAMLTVSGNSLATGSNTITASYTASGSFSNSTATATVTVAAPLTATATAVAANPATIARSGSTVIAATVKQASGSSAPAGAVTFTMGSVSLGTANLAASASGAVATLTVNGSSLAVGVNTITASYAGAGNFGKSSGSASVTVTPPPVATAASAAASPASIPAGGSTQITATVRAVSGSATPSGNVTFTFGNKSLGVATLTGSGAAATAVLTVKGSSLVTGGNSIVARYAGNGGFSASAASPVTVTMAAPPVATLTTVTASPAAIAQSASTILTAIVKPAAGNAAPTGTVSFASGNTIFGTATLSGNGSTATATLTVKGTRLVSGNNAIKATYAGAGTFTGSSGTVAVALTVASSLAAIKTTVVAVPANITQSATTQLTATVKPVTRTLGPAGSVTFASGGVLLGTASVTVSGWVGTAVLTVKGSSLTPGNNNITATYIPTGNFAGASSSVTVGVTAPPAAGAAASNVVASVTPNPASVQQGWSIIVTLKEQAGVATTLTGFTINGSDFSSAIPNFFGTGQITAHGTLSTNLAIQWPQLPANVPFGFSGVDAGGRHWTQTLSVATASH